MSLPRKASGYDPSGALVLEGVEGLLSGERIPIRLGESVLVGRSRRCHFSTRRSRRFRLASDEEQLVILSARSFLKVSRKHARITFLSPDLVEIRDLSKNGTFVNGMRVDRLMLPVPADGGVEIRLADSERLRLAVSPPAA